MVSIPAPATTRARVRIGFEPPLSDERLCRDMSAEIVRDLESCAPCSYRIVVATEHELLRQIAFWCDILARVADDIDATAAHEGDVKRKRWCES